MKLLADTFVPARGLQSSHAQSLFGVFGRQRPTLTLRRERRETPDGDFVDLDVLDGHPSKPTLLVLHGLEGSSASGSVQLMLHQAQRSGWPAMAINARSCSGELNRQAASYSSGDFRDLSWVVDSLEGRICAVGFSLGGSILLNFLAKDVRASRIEAAAAVSTPYSLAHGAEYLDSGGLIARQYLAWFLPKMKAKALAKAQAHPDRFDVKAISAATRIRDFDHLVTAPHFGFESAEAYYEACSAGPLLATLGTPTLLLSSEDDALAPPLVPADARRNSMLHGLFTQRGGHLGFAGGSPWKPNFWAEARVMDWLLQVTSSFSSAASEPALSRPST